MITTTNAAIETARATCQTARNAWCAAYETMKATTYVGNDVYSVDNANLDTLQAQWDSAREIVAKLVHLEIMTGVELVPGAILQLHFGNGSQPFLVTAVSKRGKASGFRLVNRSLEGQASWNAASLKINDQRIMGHMTLPGVKLPIVDGPKYQRIAAK